MPRQYTDEELENMDVERAANEISNVVYEASHLFERLEGKGKVIGNGHHMMQKVSKFAEDLMRDRFKDETS